MKKLEQLRLACHQLINPEFTGPGELVGWMGAVQGQDYARSKWAIGLRLKNATLHRVDEALRTGEIVRTHVMRPTWHWVAGKDLRWMLKLSSRRIRKSIDGWTKNSGVDIPESVYTKSNDCIATMLSGGKHLTKEEIESGLFRSGLPTADDRIRRYLLRAETEGIVCSGGDKDGKPTYTLLDELIAPETGLSQEEALGRLALHYFRSHSPATLKDFVWWSGLTVTEAKKAIALLGPDIIREQIEGDEFLIYASCPQTGHGKVLHFLPPYDEYLVGYKDRHTVMDPGHFPKAFNKWGIFYPVVLYDGRIIGNWQKTVKQGSPAIVSALFQTEVLDIPSGLLKQAEQRLIKFLAEK